MTGAGILPGPFARADERGLDEMLAALERAEAEWGDRFAPPVDPAPPRRAGPARQEDRPGLLPLPAARRATSTRRRPCCSRRAATVAIIWLNRPPANPLSPQVITEFGEVWKHCHASSQIRSVVIASSNIFTFSAGADIKEFTKMDASAGAGLLDGGHAMLREMEHVEHDHDRGGQQHRLRRRVRAVDGVRLPPRRRVGDVRPAGDQPRDHPRLRRHAAAAAPRRRGARRSR